MGKLSISFVALPADSSLAKLKSGRFSPCFLGVSCVSLVGADLDLAPSNLERVSRPAAQQWQADVQTIFRFVTEGKLLARPGHDHVRVSGTSGQVVVHPKAETERL